MIIFELMGMTNYIKILNEFLKKEIDYNNPKNLYDPVKYILDSGGKRLRPLITLFVSDLFTENIINALPASAASSIDKLIKSFWLKAVSVNRSSIKESLNINWKIMYFY